MSRKIKLYIISLWLLFLLLFINKVHVFVMSPCGMWHVMTWKQLLCSNVVPILSLIAGVCAVVFYSQFRYSVVQRAGDLPMTVKAVKGMEYETLSFLATFIIPLVCFDLDFDLDKNRNLLMLGLTLFFIGWIYVKTNLFHTNPSLALLGFRVYEVTTTDDRIITVISLQELKKDMDIFPRTIDGDFYYVTAK